MAMLEDPELPLPMATVRLQLYTEQVPLKEIQKLAK